tara:strand:- start:867 stop:1319 length:453 start_codon:yes stop_codon:yes gene_type:complete
MAKKKVVKKRTKKKSSPRKKAVLKKKATKKKVVKRKVVKKAAPKRKTAKKRRVTKSPKTVSLSGIFTTKKRLNPTSLGLSLAVVSALINLLVSLLTKFGYMQTAAKMMISCRLFYSQKIGGILLGSLESAVYAFFIGASIAWLYNKFSKI